MQQPGRRVVALQHNRTPMQDAGTHCLHLLNGKLCPQVTASHHGAIDSIQDLLQVHNTVSALNLGKDANAGACRHSEVVVSRPADHALQVEGQSSRCMSAITLRQAPATSMDCKDETACADPRHNWVPELASRCHCC